jgi:hypothetical protein
MAEACIDIVRRGVEDLSEKELDDLLEQMRQRQARLVADGTDPATAAAKAGSELADTLRAAASIERRNAAINFKVRTEALDYLATTWADDPVEGVLALLYGSVKARLARLRECRAGRWLSQVHRGCCRRARAGGTVRRAAPRGDGPRRRARHVVNRR